MFEFERIVAGLEFVPNVLVHELYILAVDRQASDHCFGRKVDWNMVKSLPHASQTSLRQAVSQSVGQSVSRCLVLVAQPASWKLNACSLAHSLTCLVLPI